MPIPDVVKFTLTLPEMIEVIVLRILFRQYLVVNILDNHGKILNHCGSGASLKKLVVCCQQV